MYGLFADNWVILGGTWKYFFNTFELLFGFFEFKQSNAADHLCSIEIQKLDIINYYDLVVT